MADDLPPEEHLTKRERQKARRQRKREAQAAAARRAKARRTLSFVLVAALVLGAVSVWGYGRITERQERQQAIAQAQERLGELGCTEIEEQPILPATHFSGPDLAQNPPDAIYPDRPTTSGRHIGGVAVSGAYDKVIDERLLVHNLEHGYVNIFYSDDADPSQVTELTTFVEDEISSRRHEKIIASRWKADMPGDANFALVAWGARQLCEQWDPGVALGFLAEYHYLAGNAPENHISPHLGAPGELDPTEEEGDVLFPPLSDDGPGDLEEIEDHSPDDEDPEGDAGDNDSSS